MIIGLNQVILFNCINQLNININISISINININININIIINNFIKKNHPILLTIIIIL